jgi:uncharacterized protein (TIGR03067 family)
MFLVLGGTLMLSYAAFDSSARAPIRGGSRGGQALGRFLESILGERGAEAVLSLFLLAVAAGVGFVSVRRASNLTRIIASSALVCAGVLVFGSWMAVAAAGWREIAWQREAAAKIHPLVERLRESGSAPLPDIRDKVVVWDYTTKSPSRVQTLLPKERQGSSADPALTFVLVLATRDKDEKPYTDGTPARRRTLTVAAVNWPEQKVLGVWPVEGEFPPFFTTRPIDDKGPVIGDTDGPLQRWITELSPKDQQMRKELAGLQGDWIAVQADFRGIPVPENTLKNDKITLKFKDNTFERRDDRGRFFIDPTTTPKTIDIYLDNGGPTLRGIYSMEGNTLTLSHSLASVLERPRELRGGPNSLFFVYKRER